MSQDEFNHEGGGEDEETYGLAIGIGIVEDAGSFFLAEAEVAPYIDEPGELGVTLVFHPLDGIDPLLVDEEVDWPSWPIDIDDDLVRDSDESAERQFAAIVRQLHGLKTDRLREYLRLAKEAADEGDYDA